MRTHKGAVLSGSAGEEFSSSPLLMIWVLSSEEEIPSLGGGRGVGQLNNKQYIYIYTERERQRERERERVRYASGIIRLDSVCSNHYH